MNYVCLNNFKFGSLDLCAASLVGVALCGFGVAIVSSLAARVVGRNKWLLFCAKFSTSWPSPFA